MGAFLRRFGFGLILVMAVASARPGHAASLFDNFFMTGPGYTGNIPACDDGWALNLISSRFSTKESRFWNSRLQILGYEQVRQVGYRSWAENTVPRRFCTALAKVSDGRKHLVRYSIVEDGGILGMKWGVEWCVVGLDRNWAYNPACSMAGP